MRALPVKARAIATAGANASAASTAGAASATTDGDPESGWACALRGGAGGGACELTLDLGGRYQAVGSVALRWAHGAAPPAYRLQVSLDGTVWGAPDASPALVKQQPAGAPPPPPGRGARMDSGGRVTAGAGGAAMSAAGPAVDTLSFGFVPARYVRLRIEQGRGRALRATRYELREAARPSRAAAAALFDRTAHLRRQCLPRHCPFPPPEKGARARVFVLS